MEIDPITGAICDSACFADLRVALGTVKVGFKAWLDVGVVSDWIICCTLPERGRERDERIDSPVEDGSNAKTKIKEKNRERQNGRKMSVYPSLNLFN